MSLTRRTLGRAGVVRELERAAGIEHAAGGARGACIVLPYGEELWRCFRVDRTLASRPAPAQPPTETLRIPRA